MLQSIFNVRTAAILILSIAFFKPSSSQYGSYGLTDARQLALGNTFVTNSRELYASGKNPALLANRRYDSRKFSILFPNLSSTSYNVGKFTSFINDFFSQKPLDIIGNIDGSVIMNALENDGRLVLGIQLGYIGFGYTPSRKIGSFSFTMKDYITGYLQLPKLLIGNVLQSAGIDKVIGIRDFQFSAWWMRSYELSYGRTLHINQPNGIRELSVGGGIKYYAGFLYNDIRFTAGIGKSSENGVFVGGFEARSQVSFSKDINVSNAFKSEGEVIKDVPFMNPSGTGIGFDLGLAATIEPGVIIGISITDIGRITWEGNAKSTIALGKIVLDSNITIEDIDSIFSSIVIKEKSPESFEIRPSTSLHAGVSFQINRFSDRLPGEMNLALEIHSRMGGGPLNLNFPRVASGFDWKPGKKWPIFMTGITMNGLRRMSWAAGLGYEFRFVELYLSSGNMIPVFNNQDQISFSFSACWHF